MNPPEEPRSTIPMSQEEHGAISELTATVRVLVTGFGDLKTVVKDLATGTDARFRELGERGRFTRGDVFAFVSSAFALLSGAGLLISMNTDVKLAPIQTQNQVSIVDRSGLHDDVADIRKNITAGKAERLADKQEAATEMAVRREREAEMYYALHGHYPSASH